MRRTPSLSISASPNRAQTKLRFELTRAMIV
jgi:hypothetical protein